MRKLALTLVAAGVGLTFALTAAARVSDTTFTTKVFMKGMVLSLPAGLHVRHDWNGDLKLWSGLGPNDPKGKGWALDFSLDPYTTDYQGKPLPNVGHTAAAIIASLRANRDLKVSAPKALRIGRAPARSVDVEVKAAAPKQDPSCPTACMSWIGFRKPKGGPGHFYDFQVGTASTEPTRLYLATLGSGATAHVLGVLLDASSAGAFASAAASVDALLQSVKLPTRVTPG